MSIRLYKTAALAKATGIGDVFTFPNTPQGSAWTGSVQILNAPNNALHQATISGVTWAEWIGYQPSPVIQAIGGEVIEITSTGLDVNIAYEATLLGREEDQNIYIPIWPLSSSFQVDPVTLLATAQTPAAEQDFKDPPQWMQAISIQWQDDGSGTGLGFEVFVQGLSSGGYTFFHGVVGLQQTLLVPVNGAPFRVLWFPLSGTFSGFVNFYGLQGPILTPKLIPNGPTNIPGNAHNPAQTGPQPGINFNCPAGGAFSPVIPAPPYGYMNRIRGVSCHFAAAPVAGTGLTISTTNGGKFLYRKDYDPQIPQIDFPQPVDIWVTDVLVPGIVNNINVPDGVSVANGAAVAMVITFAYEVWPTPLEAI